MNVRTVSKKELFSGRPVPIFRDVKLGFTFYVVYDEKTKYFDIYETVKEKIKDGENIEISHYGYYSYDDLFKFFEAYDIKLYIEEDEEA